MVLVLLSAMGPPAAMAGLRDDCRAFCDPRCARYTSDLCGSIIECYPLLHPLSLTCTERFYGVCATTCVTICTANTLTPSGSPVPPGTPPPPPPPPPQCRQ
ncbi:hypothetical protein BDA96_05G220500 [Sorghum bicolor]|uniref:Acidic protein n=1 Tax=Sorghum bicolor TaxID=4558 RepID=A0A921R1Q2_SORBI|nr:hypothetical protein BDA96_05G220500 [Sorghum bicolor]